MFTLADRILPLRFGRFQIFQFELTILSGPTTDFGQSSFIRPSSNSFRNVVLISVRTRKSFRDKNELEVVLGFKWDRKPVLALFQFEF